MKTQPPPLEIEEYFIDEISVRVNSKYKKPQRRARANFSISFEIKERSDDPLLFMVVLHVRSDNKKKEEKQFPYIINLKIRGFFRFIEGTDDKTIEKMLFPNSSSILYGIGRGIVAQLTAHAQFGKYILPTANMYKAKEKALP